VQHFYIGAMNSAARMRRLGGLVIAIGWLPGASVALLPPKVFTAADPREKLEAIAARRGSWTAHTIGFPAVFGITALGFGLLASGIEEPRSRRLAFAATGLEIAATLFWLPISAKRFRLSGKLDALLSEDSTAEIDIGGRTFWPYTVTTLGAIVAMGSALAVSGLRRRLGLVTGGAAALVLTLLPVLRDWPPFASAIRTTIIGVGGAVGSKDTT
jgi:hypothetical protein